MATATVTSEFVQAGDPVPVSRGAKQRLRYIGQLTPNASYAAGGDDITEPDVPSNATLMMVNISPVATDTRLWYWDGSTSTPKLKNQGVADGVEDTGDLSGDGPLTVELVYEL